MVGGSAEAGGTEAKANGEPVPQPEGQNHLLGLISDANACG